MAHSIPLVDSLAPNTPTTPLPIPVKDRRQAMDWSLVLASQGIAATIEHDKATDRWSLGVDGPDRERALASLKRYHVENKGWHWEQPLPWTGMTFHWGSSVWCLYLALIHAWIANGAVRLREAGIMDGALFDGGERWRMFTAISLHGDGSHLASNLVSGLILFGLVMARFGSGLGLLVAWLAGGAGFVLGSVVYPDPYHALGASGMVTGALGLITADALSHWRQNPAQKKRALAALAGGVMIFLLIGSDPASDLVAHLGGFVAGCGLGALLGRIPPAIIENRTLRGFLLLLFVGLVLGTWFSAL